MEDLIPPDSLMFVGGDRSNFREIGEAFQRDLVETCGLQPGHRLLDVGCGVGRLAIPLTRYLSPQGSYDGFDIVAEGIAWCRDNITPRHSNFRFALADIYNEQYNPKGRLRASEFRFPYADAAFDRVAVVSVFTHMLPPDMDHYCGELARVMAPSALCLMSWFLLNPPSLTAIDAGLSTIDFRSHVFPHHRLMSSKVPEAAVGYDEAYVSECLARHGFRVRPPVRYGVWSGRTDSPYLGYQDLVVAEKVA
jgi:SAM-dependent methyltransferase